MHQSCCRVPCKLSTDLLASTTTNTPCPQCLDACDDDAFRGCVRTNGRTNGRTNRRHPATASLINVADVSRFGAFVRACVPACLCVAQVNALLKANADPNVRCNEDAHHLADHALIMTIISGHGYSIIRQLLQAKADPTVRTTRGTWCSRVVW